MVNLFRENQKLFYQKFLDGIKEQYGASAQAPCGQGKCQSLLTNVLTVDGFKQLKDIVIGDYVIGKDGKPAKVLQTYRNGKKDCYKVIFTNRTINPFLYDVIYTFLLFSF